MRKIQLMRNIVLLSLAVIGALIMGGCSTMHQYSRVYYQDHYGRYYVDSYTGQRVYMYKSSYQYDKGPYCYKDCHGRFSKDSYGDVFYMK